ncbi:MAG TPA: EamA family transporter [Oscillatoriaceae cyanobacterium]
MDQQTEPVQHLNPTDAESRSARATLIGATAVLMWSSLVVLTTWTGAVPPVQLVAMAFTLAALLAATKWSLWGQHPMAFLRQPPAVWALGVGGLFGYHFLYFLALRLAPPIEASLINYLWPVLIVLFSALLPGERLRWFHLAGSAMGLLGTVLLVTRGGAIALDARHLAGDLAALGAAVTWAAYSVANRRFGHVPTDAVGGFCAATAVLAWGVHFAWEPTIWPVGLQWLAVAGLGLGPVGAAFFVWDHGVKHGDIRALGIFSYATPLLSTVLLIVAGRGQAGVSVWIACALVMGGAVLGSLDFFRRKRRRAA